MPLGNTNPTQLSMGTDGWQNPQEKIGTGLEAY